jgi:hypothetical protein
MYKRNRLLDYYYRHRISDEYRSGDACQDAEMQMHRARKNPEMLKSYRRGGGGGGEGGGGRPVKGWVSQGTLNLLVHNKKLGVHLSALLEQNFTHFTSAIPCITVQLL